MKRVGSLKSVFKPSNKHAIDNNNENEKNEMSILGNCSQTQIQTHQNGGKDGSGSNFLIPKGLSNFFHKNVPLKGTLTRNKNKEKHSPVSDAGGEFSYRSCLAPPLPPMAPTPKLRRVGSSTLSLNRTRKKLLTVEELYVEILYTVLHMIGCDADREEQAELVNHLKEAFHMEDDKHKQLLDIAIMREEPYLKLNLEIFAARDLIGKDMSGSSDPFCTLYLTTNPLARHYTSYKARTLNPAWNEDFVLDVNSIDTDNLRIDVWDFNPEENVSDKFKKINEIKDGRGLRKFIKEALNASAGKTTYDLLGSVEIPLKDIPSSGLDRWYALQKPDGKSKRPRGDIKAGLTLSTEKDRNLTAQEHRHLLKLLFAYELQTSQAEPFAWNGAFSKESVTILAQHAVQGKLTGADTALARWLVYAHTHVDLPLDYRVFLPILEKLRYAIATNLFLQEEENRFVEVASVFISHCIEFVKKHRHFIGIDDKYYVQLEYILKCLKILDVTLEVCEDVECGMRIRSDINNAEEHFEGFIRVQVEEAVKESIEEWYQYVADKLPLETTRAQKIKNLTALGQYLTTDLKEGCAPSQKMFEECLEVNYAKHAFEIYEKQLTEVSREIIETTCDKLKPVIFMENSTNDYVNDTLAIGTALFELYLALQSFVKLGHEIYQTNAHNSELWNCHTWFNKGVARWLDIALYKAMQRIIRAVELDDLEPVDELVKHSSSAVDIKTVLIQIKTFWQQLDWPDTEASYAFISKILDDICKTTIFYADQMCRRVVKEHNQNNNSNNSNNNNSNNNSGQATTKFTVTPHLCLAINNIDYVLQFIRPFVEGLGIDDTLEKLEITNGEVVARSCRRTLSTLVQNALENVENKILEVLDMVGEKMAPDIQKFLIQGSSLLAYAGRDSETLINYLDQNLIVLKEKLNDTNFERILSVIWESSAQSLSDTIQMSIERKKPPSYFKTLLEILKVLINFFYGDKLPQDETLLKMESLLQLYASDSSVLISKYLWERYREQKSIAHGDYKTGSITIRCQRLKEHLRVEVLNARHLKPTEPRTSRFSESRYMPVRRRQRMLQSSANLSRSQRNLQWVKSKFKSLRSNLHEASVQIHSSANNGLCDPYVNLRIVPASSFSDYPKCKTKTQRRTLFPLYDETFDFLLHHEPVKFRDAFLLITVKDSGFMGNGIFLGEALLPMSEIQVTDMDTYLRDLPQIQLPLTKPSSYDSDIILALDSRDFDQLAKEFLQKEKRKL